MAIQPWTPTLLAALAKPNEIDFASRMADVDYKRTMRDKALAELAYLPVKKRAEDLKTRAWLLQSGYDLDPTTGAIKPTAEKAAATEYLRSLMGGGTMAAPQASYSNGGDNSGLEAMFADASEYAGNATDGLPVSDINNPAMPEGAAPTATPNLMALSMVNPKLADAAYKQANIGIDQKKLEQNEPTEVGKRELSKTAAKKVIERLDTQRTKAEDAILSMDGNKQARELLDSGIITGTGAEYQLAFGKALSKAGINLADDEIANTEAFAAQRAKEVGNQIKAFGAGTGLSDADREYAKKIAAGDIRLNEKSIRRIIDIADKSNNNIIKLYNSNAERYQKVPDIAQAFPLIDLNKPKVTDEIASEPEVPVDFNDFFGGQ